MRAMAYQCLPEVLAQHDGTIRILHTPLPLAVAMAGDGASEPSSNRLQGGGDIRFRNQAARPSSCMAPAATASTVLTASTGSKRRR